MNLMKMIGLLLAAAATLAGVNYMRLTEPAQAAAAGRDVTVAAYYRFGVEPDSVVYDIWSVDGGASPAGVMGGFLKFAEKMQSRHVKEVRLAYRGETRFILSGDDFRQMGSEYSWQNPVYTLRTFPEKLERPDGSPAFNQWTGGVLGVLNAQMDDLNAFSRQWYLNDELHRMGGSLD